MLPAFEEDTGYLSPFPLCRQGCWATRRSQRVRGAVETVMHTFHRTRGSVQECPSLSFTDVQKKHDVGHMCH